MILPNFPKEPARATADDTLKKISGTMAVKIKLRKISPNGFKRWASWPKKYPAKPPNKIEAIKIMGKK
jgi:hypothetical protein